MGPYVERKPKPWEAEVVSQAEQPRRRMTFTAALTEVEERERQEQRQREEGRYARGLCPCGCSMGLRSVRELSPDTLQGWEEGTLPWREYQS